MARLRIVPFVACAALLVGCGSGGPAEVKVALAEWSVTPSIGTVAAGDVVFAVTNQGTQEHEMLVVRSDAAPDGLPVTDGQIDEASLESLGEVPETAVGESGTLRLDALPAGRYLLLCNIPGHYAKGMVAELTVE